MTPSASDGEQPAAVGVQVSRAEWVVRHEDLLAKTAGPEGGDKQA